MTSLMTAKLLLFIALSLGPKDPQTIFATSNSDNYVWTRTQGYWTLRTKGLPTNDWDERGTQPTPSRQPGMRVSGYHDSNDGDSLNLNDGSRVERQGDAVFYIVDPGAPNQKIYTILYPEKRS